MSNLTKLHLTVADPGEGSGGLGSLFFLNQTNWGPRGRKKFFWRLPPPPLSKGLDHRPLLSQCLDPALSYT